MKRLFISLLLIVILAVNFYPIFFKNQTLFCDAQSTHVIDGGGYYWQIEPFLYLNHYYFISGVMPLWNSYNGTGLPFMAVTNTGSFSPLNIFSFLIPSQFTGDISMLFRVFLAGFFLYCFLQLLGITRLSSLIASIFYMLSSHNIWCMPQFQMHTVAVTSAILFFLERVIRYNKKIDICLSILFIILAVLGGNPEEVMLTVVLTFLYYFYRVISLKQKISMYFNGLLIFVISIGLTTFFTCSAIEFFINSEIAARQYGQGINYNFGRLLLPFSKIDGFPDAWVVFLLNMVTISLILVSLIFSKKNKGLIIFFVIYIVVFLCFLFKVPVFNLAGRFPPFSHIWWGKYRATLYLSISVLCAIGLDAVRAKSKFRNIIYFVTITILLIVIYFQIPRTYGGRTSGLLKSPGVEYLKNKLHTGNNRVLPVGIRHILEPNRNCIYKIPVLGYSGALHEKRYYKFISLIFGNRPEEAVFNNSGKFLDMLGVKYTYSNRGPLLFGGVDDLIFEELKFKASRDIQPCFLSIGDKIKRGIVLFQDEAVIFKANINERTILKFSIAPDPYYFQTGYPDGISFSIEILVDGKKTTFFKKHINSKDKLRWHSYTFDLSRYKGRDIRILLKNKAERPGVWANIMLVNDLDSKVDVENPKWKMVFCDDVNGDVVYENKEVFKRVYIVHRAQAADKEDVLNIIKASDFDLRHKIILEKNIPEEMLTCKDAPLEDNSWAKITKYTPNRVFIEANMENDGFLVLSDTFYPGWKAFVDGNEQEILAANYLLRALYLGKGAHEIEFRYSPLTFKIGSVISILTVFLLIIYLSIGKYTAEKY